MESDGEEEGAKVARKEANMELAGAVRDLDCL